MERGQPHHGSPQNQAGRLIIADFGMRSVELKSALIALFRVSHLKVRLQKYLAEAGVASRRAAEQYILDGRVSVNGQVVRLLGSKVDPLHDKVLVDGQPIRAKKKIYVALNK